ncbi:MAG: YicC/YloC family endoribonuclease, partial [Planctomycetaceae bacterium]
MTGFGDARRQADRLSIAVEVRAVNNRYLKINTRFPETYAALEGRIEKTVRQAIGRGTVSVTLRIDRAGEEHAHRIDPDALRAYWQQLSDLSHAVHVPLQSDLSSLLLLPGVATEADGVSADVEHDWPAIQGTLTEA